VEAYGKDTPITFEQILHSNGRDGMFWCLRAVDEKYYPLWRHLACDYAEQVRHLMKDKRSTNALDVARRYADGLATKKELDDARAAAVDVWDDFSRAAAWDAYDAAWVAAYDVAWEAARYAAGAAAVDAGSAARGAAWDAAWAAALAGQNALLFEYCRLGERPKDSVELLRRLIEGNRK
jgi:hypothetical protein